MYFIQMYYFWSQHTGKITISPRGFWQDIISPCLGKEMFPPGLDIRCGTLHRVAGLLSCA